MSKKRTVAELKPGESGWIYYVDPGPSIGYIEMVGPYENTKYLMPQFLVRKLSSSEGVQTARDLVVFGNKVVHDTKDEAFEELTQTAERLYGKHKKHEKYETKTLTEPVNWDQIRVQAAIEILGSLIENTKVAIDVGGKCILKDVYAKTAVAFADALVAELQKERRT